MATASADHTARIWDAATGLPKSPPLKHEWPVTRVEFALGGKRLITVCGDPSATPDGPGLHWAVLWDAQTGEKLATLWHGSPIVTGGVSHDGRRIATVEVGTLHIWDAATGDALGPAFDSHERLYDISISPDGLRVALPDRVGDTRVWDIASGKPLPISLKQAGLAMCSAFSPDGRLVASASWDHTVRIWDLAGAMPQATILQHPGPVPQARFSPNGQKVVTSCYDGDLRLWDARSGAQVARLGQGIHARNELPSFSPDGKTIVASSMSTDQAFPPINSAISLTNRADFRYAAELWNLETKKNTGSPMLHGDGINDVVFSPDGRFVATASEDRTARIWDAKSGAPVCGPLEHAEGVTHICFSPDSRTLLTVSFDRTAQLWDVATGAKVGAPLKAAPHFGIAQACF